MHLVVGAVLLAQVLIAPVVGHVSATYELRVPDGLYALELGFNCEDIAADQDVEVWRIDVLPDQVVLAPLDEAGQVVTEAVEADGSVSSQMCSARIQPFTDSDGN